MSDEVIVHSWQLNTIGYPGRQEFTIQLDIPSTAISWNFLSSAGLARIVHAYVQGRTLPRWRRVWEALVGR
jgi:hypothetical protein